MSAPSAAKATRDDAARVTPMMAQYVEIKAANPDCLLFYRMGDFYELFFGDAETASRALGIVLTKRGRHNGDDIPMCGVPVERADDYLQRLIGLGHRVAVCEQMEDPAEAKKRGAKSVVRRDVVRLVTPGTITEERLLEPGRANAFLAIARVRVSDEAWSFGLACVDISTGAFALCEASEDSLAANIARIEPTELVVAEAIWNEPALRRLLEDTRIAVAPVGRESAEQSAERRLTQWYGVATLDSFGALSRAKIAAAAMAIVYIERTQLGARPALAFPVRMACGDAMEIDAATRANLELTRTLSGHREGSLLSAIDATATPAGGRLLAERLAAPLTDPAAIAARADAVAFLLERRSERDDLRTTLRGAPDMARSLSRLALGRGGPRDLAALRDGLLCAAQVGATLSDLIGAPDELRDAARIAAGVDPAIADSLRAALAYDLPLNKRDGGFIAKECEPALDELRALRDESRKVVAGLQARYADIAGTKQLRIKHNNFLGYFIEVQQAQGEKMLRPPLDAEFIHRQTMADAMRFSTRDLAELEAKIASAADRALALELEIFDRLATLALSHTNGIKAASEALAAIDVAAGLAAIAEKHDWSRPLVDDSLAFVIEGARHPVVEAALRLRGEAFVANDCALAQSGDRAGLVAVVTGPNMAGKSTYLRQNALIAILAQIGSFVPARSAHIGVVDRLFSRVGAADDLARGRSTFMVEMVETAAILNQAGERAFVILDEIGRGTATFDGLSIAWATVEYLHAHSRSRTLFATHFHELTQLTKKLPRLVNLTMRVTDWNGEVIFLHEVMKGAADRSYGIQVARLAGLPQSVIDRATTILAELEAGERRAPVARMIDDLPLFAVSPAATPTKPDALRAALDMLDPDAMSPREALEAVYALKQVGKEK